VLYADEMPVVVGADDVGAVKAMVPRSALGRARLCAHRDPAAALQEMLIVLDPGTYLRPAKHLGKAESLLFSKARPTRCSSTRPVRSSTWCG
jgi:cupin fold WbuC family metalloprotein